MSKYKFYLNSLKAFFLDFILFFYLIVLISLRFIKFLSNKNNIIKNKNTNWNNIEETKINNSIGIRIIKIIIKQYPLKNKYKIRKRLIDFTYEMF